MSDNNEDIYLRRWPRNDDSVSVEPDTDENSSEDEYPVPDPLRTEFQSAFDHHDARESFWFSTTGILISAIVIIGVLFLTVILGQRFFVPGEQKITITECAEACAAMSQKTDEQVVLQRDSLVDWLGEVDGQHYGTKRSNALLLSASQSDNLIIGLIEQYHRDEDDAAALFYLFAGLSGYEGAAGHLNRLELSDDQAAGVKSEFIEVHRINGGRGFLKLGQISLNENFKKQGPGAVVDRQYGSYRRYLPARDNQQAFLYFQLAAMCGYGEAYDWLTYMTPDDGLTATKRDELRKKAASEMDKILTDYGVSKSDYCSGVFAKARFPAPPPSGGNGSRDFGSSRFDASGASSGDASKAYRDNPGGVMAADDTSIDPNCVGSNDPENCIDRSRFLTCADQARYWFNRGEAEMAVGNTRMARAFFSKTIEEGRPCGAEAAVLASKRLAALNLPCEYSPESLARIARGLGKDGNIITLEIRQKALEALGHYQGKIDGKYGPQTRRAVSDFQREFGFEETGDLSPLETVYLICSAADNARDRNAKNVLGIMYVTGLGVVQNTDTGLLWLKDAADSGDVDALYNLAIIYGSGTVLSSYRLCDMVENIARADAYLIEARAAGHPIARALLAKYGRLSPSERWAAIRTEELQKIEFYNNRLGILNPGCGPAITPDNSVSGQDDNAVSVSGGEAQ